MTMEKDLRVPRIDVSCGQDNLARWEGSNQLRCKGGSREAPDNLQQMTVNAQSE